MAPDNSSELADDRPSQGLTLRLLTGRPAAKHPWSPSLWHVRRRNTALKIQGGFWEREATEKCAEKIWHLFLLMCLLLISANTFHKSSPWIKRVRWQNDSLFIVVKHSNRWIISESNGWQTTHSVHILPAGMRWWSDSECITDTVLHFTCFSSDLFFWLTSISKYFQFEKQDQS